jgi:hypothetical protein
MLNRNQSQLLDVRFTRHTAGTQYTKVEKGLGVVVHSCNPSIWKAKAGEL